MKTRLIGGGVEDAKTESRKPMEVTLTVAQSKGLAEELVRNGWIMDAF